MMTSHKMIVKLPKFESVPAIKQGGEAEGGRARM